MGGRGPAPKHDGRRARRNKQPGTQVFYVDPAAQPALPAGRDWPVETFDWWATWAEHPLAGGFTTADWQFLLDTALLHAAVWGDGEVKHLPELRLRVAKFGVTPEDRARLRIQFAEADARDKQRGASEAPDDGAQADSPQAAARSRYGRRHLVAVDSATEDDQDDDTGV